jgi:endogenous inhibitor of DNA gyrase (YacG/DUF329 family)
MTKQIKECPICHKPINPSGEDYPFCSERCKTVDLGNWASEKYATHSPMTEADENLDSEYPPESLNGH